MIAHRRADAELDDFELKPLGFRRRFAELLLQLFDAVLAGVGVAISGRRKLRLRHCGRCKKKPGRGGERREPGGFRKCGQRDHGVHP